MRLYEILKEARKSFGDDPHYQFHMSVEPNLKENTRFSEQHRTVSVDGARGDVLGEGNLIYTTLNLSYWGTQFFYEEVNDYPAHIYLVYVENPSKGSIHAAHQDASKPNEVTVIVKLGVISVESDNTPDYGKFIWKAEKLLNGMHQ